MTTLQDRKRTGGGRRGAAIAVTVGVVLSGIVVVVALLASRVGDDDPGTSPTVVQGVPEDVYADITPGAAKEDVLRSLLPAEPLDTDVLAEYRAREPETPAAECVYFESDGGTADDRYRFCFVDDELVDKTVILPPEDGVTGD